MHPVSPVLSESLIQGFRLYQQWNTSKINLFLVAEVTIMSLKPSRFLLLNKKGHAPSIPRNSECIETKCWIITTHCFCFAQRSWQDGSDAAGVQNRSSYKKGQRTEGPNEELQSSPARQEHEMGQFSRVLIGLQNYQDNLVPIIHTKNDCCPFTEATGSHMSSKQQQTTGFTCVWASTHGMAWHRSGYVWHGRLSDAAG